MKANDNLTAGRIIYPIAPQDLTKSLELDMYTHFMRHLRMIPHTREEVKILNAIEFVATMTASSEAHVTKVLIDLGLRAPRFALPASYLDYADSAILRHENSFGAANNSLKDLDAHWAVIGEQRFPAYQASFQGHMHDDYLDA